MDHEADKIQNMDLNDYADWIADFFGTEGTDDVRNAILLENLIRTRELLQERMDEVEKEIKKIEAGEKIEEDDKPVASGAMKDKTEDAELVPAE